MFRHLTMAELIELRDKAGSAAARDHVESCAECGRELERLHQRTAALRAMPSLQPPRDRWPAVMEQRARARRLGGTRWLALGGLAATAAVALVVGLGAPAAPADSAPADQIEALIDESRRLEELLRAVQPEGRVINGLTAATIADLEDRLAALDEFLVSAVGTSPPPADVRNLWQERVALMGALVNTHVRQVSYVGF
jgi:hypothetical protein